MFRWRKIKKFLITIGKPAYFILINKWFWLGFTATLLGSGGWWTYNLIFRDLPNINEIYNPPKLSTKIYDRNGVLLYKFYEDENRSWVGLKQIPKSMIDATLAIEDKSFYKHKGVSVKGLVKAAWYNISNKVPDQDLRGGSTITQQLAKSIFLTNEKTFRRKIKELILAFMIENKLSKDEILERYFNQVAYGGEIYGVQEAAWKYFGKNIEDIDKAQAAFLAGLPAAPSSYSPTGSNPEYGKLRQKHVIEEMIAAGFINNDEGQRMKEENISILKNKTKILAPHFVFYVKNYLEKKFGYTNFSRRGLEVITSLDYSIQQQAEKIVGDEMTLLKRLRINNGGVLVMDPQTGEILAMVGSKDYFAADIDGKFNVTTALRQPGSSIKPINYLLAFENGWTPASMIEDTPIAYQIKGQKPYVPQNYNGKFMGKVTLRTALASSLNIPSVKLLAANGVDNMINLAEEMGITTWGDRKRFGLALALGGGEVKMEELAQSYSTFANMGFKVEASPVLEIKNYLKETTFRKENEKIKIVEPKYTFLINSILSDNNARSPIFGTNSKLKIENKTVAVKTGTTNSLKDNWCIGWTPSVLVAAWVGNNDNTPMSWVASGVTGATPIWNKIMTKLISTKANEEWAIPKGVVREKICGKEEYFIDGTQQKVKCMTTPTLWPTNTVKEQAH